MNLKRVLLISLILIALAASLTVVSADKAIKIDGVNFNIPDGFEENKSSSVDGIELTYANEYDAKGYGKLFSDGNDEIIIMILEPESVSADDLNEFDVSRGCTSKTINGIEGLYSGDGEDFSFSFIEDGKYCVITASNEGLFESVVPK